MRASLAIPACLVACSCGTMPPVAADGVPHLGVAETLDELHDAASEADDARYFELFAPDAVFLGTDATERWPIDEFRRYATARFETGTGWTYTVASRHVFVSDDGCTAWFDETLHNEKYGVCRGTGVLVRRAGVWKIAQYNLTIPIPNDIALDVVEMIEREASRGR